ncbi:hypothetical protein [Cytophaga aurantiaca]|uniref:hypothetical protein n=1 Tax=Cytophaga aurantiaca TaxID=29530 RepID=UPI0003665D7C|nr:hypothetical protein [Cytophaga aurantiaca]
MKKVIVFLAAAAFALQVNAQTTPEKVMDKDVPTAVSGTFKKAHPNASMISWKKMDGKYAAEYDENSTKTWSVYDASGKLVETKVKIKESEAPQAVVDYANNNHKDILGKDYYKITDAKGVVTYAYKANDKKLIFDSKGNYIKTEDCKD